MGSTGGGGICQRLESGREDLEGNIERNIERKWLCLFGHGYRKEGKGEILFQLIRSIMQDYEIKDISSKFHIPLRT
jgi:hypothetical protein